MEDLFWIGFVGAAIALLFAWLQRSRVMSFSEGNEKMRKIAASIREGAKRLSEAPVHHSVQGVSGWCSSSC